MLTTNNGQIFLYCHFNKIVKARGTSSKSPALVIDRNMLEMFVIQHTSI